VREASLDAALGAASVTRAAVVARGALSNIGNLARDLAPERKPMIIADERTFLAAGEAVRTRLKQAGCAQLSPVILPGRPRLKPRADDARSLAETIRGQGAVAIAVGSGVINDLVKLASEMAGESYLCVATAASMDGYAASGAAVIEHGFKRTLPCRPPIGIVADLDVIAAAPPAMAGWGFGDLAGKVVAGADWLLADALHAEAIDERAYTMVQTPLEGWLSCAHGIGAADPGALRGLVEGLLVTGFAMQAHGSSRPASGSDHLFAHLWEMEGLCVDGSPVSHGACVGVGCLTMLHLYEWLQRQDLTALDIERCVARQPDLASIEREINDAFRDRSLRANARSEMKAKRASRDVLRARLKRCRSIWPDLRKRLAQQLPSAATMRKRLNDAGAASDGAAIGVSAIRLAADCRRARLIRRRYTVLDLLDETGWLDRAIDEALPSH